MAEPRRSAGGVLLHGGRVVLIGKRENGEWRLPKGRLDDGEDAAAAALREVAEETGFADCETVADLGEQHVRFTTADGHRERLEQFLALRPVSFRRTDRTPRDGFRFRVVWVPVDEALELLSFESEREALRRALRAVGLSPS